MNSNTPNTFYQKNNTKMCNISSFIKNYKSIVSVGHLLVISTKSSLTCTVQSTDLPRANQSQWPRAPW